jgi:DNA mismatch repair protein MutS
MIAPARRQYLDIKAHYQDAILLYQVGDFYETFDDDARIAARELQIVLTGRSYGTDERVPLAGVPTHALDNYAAKLVARGYKVAICDQVSPPGRGLVRREVTRILTPGTVVSPAMVPPSRDNYLVAIALAKRSTQRSTHGGHASHASGFEGAGLAYIDASTGAFSCTQWPADRLNDAVRAELERLSPAEIIISEAYPTDGESDTSSELPWHNSQFLVTACPAHFFDAAESRARLCQHFQTPTLAAFVPETQTLAIAASGAILAYIERMNPALLPLVTGLRQYETHDLVEIDGRTWRALEVVEPAHSIVAAGATKNTRSERAATLLGTLDGTRTLMGSRLLRRTLLAPLRDRLTLEERLDAISEIHADIGLQQRLSAALDGLCDLERLTARVVQGTAVPRELQALRIGLKQSAELAHVLRNVHAPALKSVQQTIDPCPQVCTLVEQAIADHTEHPGQTIRPGYSAELDGIVSSIAEARAWIAGLEAIERERTGIKSLKVGYNKVFGYYLEVSNANRARVPPEYERRQTLVNGERYVTVELKERESLVTHAEEQIADLETRLYREVLREIAAHQARLRATAQAVAQADVWLALALVARARGYVRPELSDATDLHIVAGRHPIIESALDGVEFIANDTTLDSLESGAGGTRIMLLTGPNMAGKSTYLRQVATIVLMAQVGSFVPARAARIGLVDRISCRVGAEDDLARGLSTFMLEMVETAYILRQSTARSLVILDEVGRGTSTHDGLAIARAVIEHLHDAIGARTLFATHYHELAILERSLDHLRAFQMEVVERDGEAIFLHRVVPGASTQSYGVQVARMAGLPPSVTERAAAMLSESIPMPGNSNIIADDRDGRRVAERPQAYRADEDRDANEPDNAVVATAQPQDEEQLHATREVALALASLNIAAMTPLEAINVIFSLQQQALAALHMQRP